MATVKNDWVGYLDRSYEQIKAALLGRLVVKNPEMTDHSDSNPLVIFITMFAGLLEMLGYYIDNAARESFIATARRRSSIIKLAKGLDYRIKARSSEKVDLLLTWNAPIASGFTLQSGFTIDSDTGVRFRLMADRAITAGSVTSSIPLNQETPVTANLTSNGQRNQRINLGSSYVQGSLNMSVSLLAYTEQDTFAISSPTDRHYIVDIDEDGNAYAILGDGINGVLPVNGAPITLSYTTTLGPSGKVGAGKFVASSIILNGSLPGGVTISSANSVLNSSGGADYEDTERIRNNAVRSIRTLNRMVTESDHEFVINAVAGVAKSRVDFSCGKNIDIYIVPEGGGIASSGLILAAQTEANLKKMVTTFPVAKPAGETRLVLGADVTAKKRRSLADTRTQVENALIAFGNVSNQEINGAIRLSDLQALIDNQPNVDFVDIVRLYTIPYARPVGHNNVLVWTTETLASSIAEASWRVEYNGTIFQVFREGIYLGNISIGSEFSHPNFRFTISVGSYAAGNTWEFKTLPYLRNLQLTDFTIFTIQNIDLNINVLPNPSV